MIKWLIWAGSALLAAGSAVGLAQTAEGETQDSGREALSRAMASLDFGEPYLAAPLSISAALVPPPPAEGTLSLALDFRANQAALSLRGSPRWDMATRDADLTRGAVLRAFSCAAGVTLSDEATPIISELLRRSRSDFGSATGAPKQLYARQRPFAVNSAPSCTPDAEPFLARDGSYPSGHAAIGHGTGLVLATLFPSRASELVSRGISYGESRTVCNVHWISDVEAARPIADATFARLLADKAFQRDWQAARAEAAALVIGGEPESCAQESIAR